jgi:predicted RNA-binding protein Jag
MRFEGKSEEDARDRAAEALARPPAEVRYRVVRDEKSFWGGRVVEIEVEGEAPQEGRRERLEDTEETLEMPARASAPARAMAPRDEPSMEREEPILDEEAWSVAESTLNELLSVAGFLLEVRRHPSQTEMLFELIGDDIDPLLNNKGEGINGLEVLVGRIAAKRLGRQVHPRVDADGFRAHQKESLEELAQRTAEEVRRTRRAQLLPPLAPRERRLVHLALAEAPDVMTESEGDGYLKRVAVRLK